jgi:hypothetical protein
MLRQSLPKTIQVIMEGVLLLDCHFLGDPDFELPSYYAPRFLTLRNSEITHVCCFKSQFSPGG